MSGIFAFCGNDYCKDTLLKGVDRLQKRGKEMAGIVIKGENSFREVKVKGGVLELFENAQGLKNEGFLGIAKCENALRCKASSMASGPASNELFSVASDGYIENFEALRRWTKEPFPIVTDDELLLSCLSLIKHENKNELLFHLANSISGDASFVFMSIDENAIYCYSGGAPLIIGTGKNGSAASSELSSIVDFCDKYVVLEKGESARLTFDRTVFFDSKQKRIKKTFVPSGEQSVFENDYSLFDEIYYCALTARETYSYFVKNAELNAETICLSRRTIERTKRIILSANGASLFALKTAKSILQGYCDIPVECDDSGELLFSPCVIDRNTLVIAASHRGENKNTVNFCKRAKAAGAKVLGITSSKTSALSRVCDGAICPPCDFERGEVSFRQFISVYLSLCFLSLYIGRKSDIVTELYLSVAIKMSELLPGKISSAVKGNVQYEKAAKTIRESKKVFVTGLASDAALALEGADKLRSVSKTDASAVGLSELIYYENEVLENSLCIVLLTNRDKLSQTTKNALRLAAKGAKIIVFTSENLAEELFGFENVVTFSDSLPLFNPLILASSLYKTSLLSNNSEKENKEKAAIAV